MTTYERAGAIIASVIEQNRGADPVTVAGLALEAMLAKRIMPTTLRASGDMFTRFHAHTRFLGETTGYGYTYWYRLAVDTAADADEWPCKLIARTVTLDTGESLTVDVQVPESSTRATNAQLLYAYNVILDGARDAGITLPENE